MPRSRSILHGTWFCVVAGALFLHPAGSARADVFHVKADAAGAGDGSSWPDAFTDLQSALTAAAAGDEIRVATGTYRPSERTDPADPRSVTFQLRSGVAIHGGFAGTETTLAERAGLFEQTILTGDLNADDAPVTKPADLPDEPTRAENAYHVVTGSGTDETAILDGFTITAGQANGEFPHIRGGGMLNDEGAPTVDRCTFIGNTAQRGGGMHNQSAAPNVEGCAFIGNVAISGGGMVNAGDSAPTLTACVFRLNHTFFLGGAMTNGGTSHVVLHRCTFEDNSTEQEGGAVYTDDRSTTELVECTLARNVAPFGGGIFGQSGNLFLTSCTLSDHTDVREGGALFNNGADAVLTDCTIRDNTAANRGGGVLNFSRTLQMTGCRILGNGTNVDGGVISREAEIRNCLFRGNRGAALGYQNVSRGAQVINSVFVGNDGGIGAGNHSFITVTNCTIVGNRLGSVGASESSSVTVTNCIIWDNRKGQPGGQQLGDNVQVTYSCIQDGFPGDGNIDVDPRFVRPPNDGGDGWSDEPRTPDLDEGANDNFGDLRLRAASPCIDAGDSGADTNTQQDGTQPLPPTDLAGNPRILDDPATPDSGLAPDDRPVVDMGAFEFVLEGDSDLDYDVDLADYLFLIQCMNGPGAPFEQGCHPADLDRDGDGDLADVVQFHAAFTGAR